MNNMKLIMENFRKFKEEIRIVDVNYIDTESVLERSESCRSAKYNWEDGCYKDGVTKEQWDSAKKAIADCGDDKEACEKARKNMDDLIGPNSGAV